MVATSADDCGFWPVMSWPSLIGVSVAAYLLIFTWPFTQQAFHLDSSNADLMRTGLLIGLVGAVLIEALWWVKSFVFGEPRRLWRRTTQ